MGQCFSGLLRYVRKQRHLHKKHRPKYASKLYEPDQEDEIEIQTLLNGMDSDSETESETRKQAMTEEELAANTKQKLADIMAEQARLDAELDEQLAEQEADLRLEEEVYNRERRAVAEAARHQLSAQQPKESAATWSPRLPRSDTDSISSKDLDQVSLGQISLDRLSLDRVSVDRLPATPTSDDFDAFLADVRASTLAPSSDRVTVAT